MVDMDKTYNRQESVFEVLLEALIEVIGYVDRAEPFRIIVLG
jgi:hypothetical protein